MGKRRRQTVHGKSLTERIAADVIMRARWLRNVVVPNFTPTNWFECDVCELTKAGYFREYEIKLTRFDFFNDRVKSYVRSGVVATKHDLILRGCNPAPCQFWFVAPAGMIERSELPSFSGLIELEGTAAFGRSAQSGGTIFWKCREVVEAPRLHRDRADEQIRIDLMSACYYRMHNLLVRLVRDREKSN